MGYKKYVFLIVTMMVTLLFQNCGPGAGDGDPNGYQTSASVLQQSGNGVGYGGKPDQYGYFDPDHPCEELDLNLMPLPNKRIELSDLPIGPKAFVVRENCKDLALPRPLPPAFIQRISETMLLFEGLIFKLIQGP